LGGRCTPRHGEQEREGDGGERRVAEERDFHADG
jgi:hypothetical protein